MLEEAFLYSKEIIDYKIISQFFSKKNEVFLVSTINRKGLSKPYILKIYKTQESYNKDLKFLTCFKKNNLFVPAVEYEGKESVVLEFISGVTVFDVFMDAEKERLPLRGRLLPVINDLCHWLQSFYAAAHNVAAGTIMGDINLRNFIVTENGICGLDFEDCKEGRAEEDAGRLCAYTLTYLPAFTVYKMDLVSLLFARLTVELRLNINLTKQEIRKELYAIEVRRDITILDTIDSYIKGLCI